jgi:hypothetical protein
MSAELDNLVRTGLLKHEPSSPSEIDGLIASGVARLRDAQNTSLALESRFDLAYNAAHALALAALRQAGYRTDKRYVVFQVLELTLGVPASTWRVLAKAHAVRNQAEYEGLFEADESLTRDTVAAAIAVRTAL